MAGRIVYITDSDWRAELIKYKIDERINSTLDPIKGEVSNIKQTVKQIETNQVPVVVYQQKTKYRTIDMTTKKPVIIQ